MKEKFHHTNMRNGTVRLTEAELYRIIEKTTNAIVEDYKRTKSAAGRMRKLTEIKANFSNDELRNMEDWERSYHDWADGPLDDKDAIAKNEKWHSELKKAHPDKNSRRQAMNTAYKRRDVAFGRTNDKEQWRKYDRSMDED